jgi:hypothetical protein
MRFAGAAAGQNQHRRKPKESIIMKPNSLKFATLALVPAALLGFTSCSTPLQSKEEVTAFTTPDGATIVETITVSATVTAIDSTTRKITLSQPGGGKTTYKVGPEAVNFSQIQIGDQVKAVVTEQAAIFLRRQGAPPSAGAGAAVALAPRGAKPGGMLVDTEEITATITAVDAPHRKVTFQLVDGSKKTVTIGKRVDLANVKVGESLTVELSEGLALTVQKP